MLDAPTREQAAATALADALQPLLEAKLADPLSLVQRRLGQHSECLWLTHGGQEYLLIIKPSARQQARWARRS